MDIVYILKFVYEYFFFDVDDEDEEDAKCSPKIYGFAETIVPQYSGRQFVHHFRITPETLDALVGRICVTNNYFVRCNGNPEIDIQKQVLVTVWYIANLEAFRSIADRFGISKSTAWLCVRRTCKRILLMSRINRIIHWPNEDLRSNVRNFTRKSLFPGIIGALDGSHIPIKAPKDNHISYVNRKGYHSILLQGVCDANCKFIDVYVGEAGSIHDACMFRRSNLSEKFANFNGDMHLVADSAYPLSMHIMVPFKDNGHLTDIERNYNYIHGKARVVIEHTFALLKGRFRRLKLIENVDLTFIPQIIMVATILHNLCLSGNDHADVNIEGEREEEHIMNVQHVNDEVENNASLKRRQIANRIYIQNVNV